MSGNKMSEDALESICSKVSQMAVRYPVSEMYLSGSRARGDNAPGSDYDSLIVPKEHTTAFQMCGMLCELEDVFGAVDLVFSRSISGNYSAMW